MIAAEIKANEVKYPGIHTAVGILLISLGFLLPVLLQHTWFNIIEKIREAINTGDSGHLILASASMNALYATQSTFLFIGTMLVMLHSKLKSYLKTLDIFLISLNAITLLHWINAQAYDMPWEPVSTILALIITLFLFGRMFVETNSYTQVLIVSIQVFFAFQWLNIMPVFSPYLFGQSDISYSIKIAGIYLHAGTVLNFTGFAFFMPFIISAFITATLFISYSRNMHMMKENYEKENEIRNMRAKALEDRVYQEVKSLVHDLKTPLVTIRGLNSLLLTAVEHEKFQEYSERIENSVTKMSEMISSYLYDFSRQKLKTTELISYIRAQLPLEDEKIKFSLSMDEELPLIYVNKIRIARAIINVLENAIIVPYKHQYKLIDLDVKGVSDGINISVKDNGIGIKESDIHRIWEVGYSTNNTSGLGLPFAKQVIEDNSGTIKVISQSEVGTTVTIFLPSVESVEETAQRKSD